MRFKYLYMLNLDLNPLFIRLEGLILNCVRFFSRDNHSGYVMRNQPWELLKIFTTISPPWPSKTENV